MISPWEIYLVMQLDSIGAAAITASLMGSVALIFMWMWIVDNQDGIAARLVGAAFTTAWALCVAVAIFIPSSKTAAAMIVIPAIANNEKFQDEAGDLYRLAKQGLEKLVAAEPEKKPAAE